MDLLDVDGDHIHFLIDPQGRLRESLGSSVAGGRSQDSTC